MSFVLGLLGALAAAVLVVLGIFLIACVLPTLPKLIGKGQPSHRTLDALVNRPDLGQPVLSSAPRGRVNQLKSGTPPTAAS